MDPNDIIQWTGLIIALIALLISSIALVYTILSYLLKSGHEIRCNYSICSSREGEDKYISELTLENLKDRATVIFSIYLKIGNNNFLEIENFENSPLILKPFEVYSAKYGAVQFYLEGVDYIRINNLLGDDKIKKYVLLSTTDGKYVVRPNTKRWDPVNVYFNNFFTSIIRPSRLYYKEQSYGSNVKFLLIFKYKSGKEEVVPIQNGDEKVRVFENVALTKESLESAINLEEFIRLQKDENRLEFDDLEIFSLKERKSRILDTLRKDLTGEAMGFIKFYLKGTFFTLSEKRKINRENKQRKKKHHHSSDVS